MTSCIKLHAKACCTRTFQQHFEKRVDDHNNHGRGNHQQLDRAKTPCQGQPKHQQRHKSKTSYLSCHVVLSKVAASFMRQQHIERVDDSAICGNTRHLP